MTFLIHLGDVSQTCRGIGLYLGAYLYFKLAKINLNVSMKFGLIDGRTYIIGREGHIRINSPSVSKQHLEMKIKHRRVYLRDLDSTNGTYLVINNHLVRHDRGYVDQYQTIVIGNVKCTIRDLLTTNRANSD
jgi:pSer/pThr/pTyr-binding forkhead associated (FHA) protein